MTKQNLKNTAKAFFLAAIICCMHINAFSQKFLLNIVVTDIPEKHKQDDLFVAGNFNDWNPGSADWRLKKQDGKHVITIPLQQKGNYEFKFTRGGWDKAMSTSAGADVENLSVALNSDTTIFFKIAGWKDDFAPVEKKHTYSKNVHIIEQAIIMPQLDRSRRIWIYLPDKYKSSIKRYPVLYMHDAQNLFDDYTSGFGEWGIDECLDSLMKQSSNECIVVGIENGPKRTTEYNPYDNERYGKGEGAAYVAFLIQTLKPYIDKNYRTLKDPTNTMIAGSSLGGSLSFYAALFYPNTFGKAGVFSPSFWIAPEMFAATDSLATTVKGKLFFYIGGKEGDEHIENMYKIMQKLGTGSSALLYSVVDAEGKHNEVSWRKWFPEFFRFMMADWTNYIIKD